jgi:hypothetical protein
MVLVPTSSANPDLLAAKIQFILEDGKQWRQKMPLYFYQSILSNFRGTFETREFRFSRGLKSLEVFVCVCVFYPGASSRGFA